jgi:hypothetical protein
MQIRNGMNRSKDEDVDKTRRRGTWNSSGDANATMLDPHHPLSGINGTIFSEAKKKVTDLSDNESLSYQPLSRQESGSLVSGAGE